MTPKHVEICLVVVVILRGRALFFTQTGEGARFVSLCWTLSLNVFAHDFCASVVVLSLCRTNLGHRCYWGLVIAFVLRVTEC